MITSEDSLTPAEMDMWRTLLRTTQQVTAGVGSALAERSMLSVADFQVLIRVSYGPEDGLPQQQLRLDIGWSESRTSHQLRRMQERGHIVRTPAGHGRSMAVRLTRAGADALAAALPVHAIAVRARFTSRLTARDRQDLMRICAKLLADATG